MIVFQGRKEKCERPQIQPEWDWHDRKMCRTQFIFTLTLKTSLAQSGSEETDQKVCTVGFYKLVYKCYRYYTIVRSPRGQVCQMASCSVAVTISLLWTISLALMVPLFLYQDVDVVTVGGEWNKMVCRSERHVQRL